MQIAILNDTHAGVKNGSDIFLDYSAKFYNETFFPYLLEKGIKKIVHLGDYFEHRKYVNYKVLEHNYKCFISKLYEYDMTMDIIPGNHDVYYKNTNALNSIETILSQYSDRITIHMNPVINNYDGLDVALVPWICKENEEECMDFITNASAPILMGHLELGGFQYMAGANIKSHGMDKKVFNRYEAVYSGHYHTKSTQENVTYLGTQYELTWSDAGDPKYFHVLNTDTRELTPVKNENVLFQKIYYNEDELVPLTRKLIEGTYIKVIVTNKKDLYAFDKYMEKLYDFNPHEVRIIENFDEYGGDNVEDDSVKVDDTPTLLNSYIDATETNLNNDILKKMMQELLTEAQALDTI
jgi:hypothetical protein